MTRVRALALVLTVAAAMCAALATHAHAEAAKCSVDADCAAGGNDDSRSAEPEMVCLRTKRCGPREHRRACGNKSKNVCAVGDMKRCTRDSNCVSGSVCSRNKDRPVSEEPEPRVWRSDGSYAGLSDYKTCKCPRNQVWGSLPPVVHKCGVMFIMSVMPPKENADFGEGCMCPAGLTLDEATGWCLEECCDGPMVVYSNQPCTQRCEDGELGTGCAAVVKPGCGCPKGRSWYDSVVQQCFDSFEKCPPSGTGGDA